MLLLLFNNWRYSTRKKKRERKLLSWESISIWFHFLFLTNFFCSKKVYCFSLYCCFHWLGLSELHCFFHIRDTICRDNCFSEDLKHLSDSILVEICFFFSNFAFICSCKKYFKWLKIFCGNFGRLPALFITSHFLQITPENQHFS